MFDLGGIFNDNWTVSVRLICDYFFGGGCTSLLLPQDAETPSYVTAG